MVYRSKCKPISSDVEDNCEPDKKKLKTNDQLSQKMTPAQLQHIDDSLSLFLFGCKEPFTIVESQYFKDFVHSLNPEYKIPSRKTVASTLLPRCYKKRCDQEKCLIKQDAILLMDGWKNDSSDKKLIVAMAKVRSTGKEILLKSYDLSAERIDADKVSEVMGDAIQYGENKFNLNIDSIISDNEATMRKAAKESMLIDITCNAHTGNLYVADIHDHELYNTVHSLLVYFRDTKLQAKIVGLGGKKLYIKGLTR